jgi:hypothetical protein
MPATAAMAVTAARPSVPVKAVTAASAVMRVPEVTVERGRPPVAPVARAVMAVPVDLAAAGLANSSTASAATAVAVAMAATGVLAGIPA